MTLLTQELIESNTYKPDYELFPVVKSLSYMSHINALRLMYLIHRTIGKSTRDDLTYIEIPISQELLSYLELSKEESPLASIDYALYLIARSPIFKIHRDAQSYRTWSHISWFIGYSVCEKSKVIRLQINPLAIHYFKLLECLSPVRPQSCIRLSRDAPMWLYIVLKNASLKGDYWIPDAEDFSRWIMLKDKETYPKEVRIKAIPRFILGISPTEQTKSEEKLARKEKRPIHFTPSVFTPKGGNLQVLREKSELLVNYCNVKIKNTITYLAFSFREEDSNGIVLSDTSQFSKSAIFAEELDKTILIESINITNS